jgi:hypothetical protein
MSIIVSKIIKALLRTDRGVQMNMRMLYVLVGICILTLGIGYGQDEAPSSKLSGNWWITYTEPDVGITTWYMTISKDYTATLYKSSAMLVTVANINFDVQPRYVSRTWYGVPENSNIATISGIWTKDGGNTWFGDNMNWDDHPGRPSSINMVRIKS